MARKQRNVPTSESLSLVVELCSTKTELKCLRCELAFENSEPCVRAKVGQAWRRFHFDCFKVPCSVTSVSDFSGVSLLSKADHEKFTLLINNSIDQREESSSSKRKQPNEEHETSKRAKTETETISEQLAKYSVKTLRNMLTTNDQITSGTKSDLIARIADCIANGGAAPACPMCQKGHLRTSSSPTEAIWTCPGYFENRKYRKCTFRCAVSDLPRIPWQDITGHDKEAAEYELQRDTDAT